MIEDNFYGLLTEHRRHSSFSPGHRIRRSLNTIRIQLEHRTLNDLIDKDRRINKRTKLCLTRKSAKHASA